MLGWGLGSWLGLGLGLEFGVEWVKGGLMLGLVLEDAFYVVLGVTYWLEIYLGFVLIMLHFWSYGRSNSTNLDR